MTHNSHNLYWKTGAIFIIALVLSIPFYSASVYAASLSITANSGQGGIENYLDAQGDVWRIEATIANAGGAVDPAKVQLKVGENYKSFNSCSEGALGASCELLSPLTNGVAERQTAFMVEYQYVDDAGQDSVAQDSDVIRADGTAPQITIINPSQQADGKVSVNLKVNERVNQGAPFVGIKQIDILDALSGALLDSKTDFPPQKELFDEAVWLTFSGEGMRQIKVRAVDHLGHERTATSSVFNVDFVKPEIKIETLNFETLGEFIGDVIVQSDLVVDVVERSDLDAEGAEVRAFSEQAALNGAKGVCDPDEEEEALWHCRWVNVEVQPTEAVTVRIVAKDEFGNQAEESTTRNFVKDVSAPAVEFFGTGRVFAGRSYVKSGENKIILQARDQGADLSLEGIRANLGALGKGQFEAPDECGNTESTFNCIWATNKRFSSDGIIHIGLSKFQDRVGNEGEAGEVELVVDTAGPKVVNMSVFGVSDIGDKKYFQSNDRIKLDFYVQESSGLTILIDLDGVVMDARNNYLENELTMGLGDGWGVFTEQDCEQMSESLWHCVIETEGIKSGPVDDVRLALKVRDTAGNEAQAWPDAIENAGFDEETAGGVIIFDLLGLSLEDNPDYWEVDKVKSQVQFVDLDTTELTSTRVAYEVTLQSSSAAKINSLDLLGCENDGSIALGRQVVWNNQYVEGQASPVKFTLMLEFPPFNGRELFANKIHNETDFTTAQLDNLCRVRIFSQLNDAAFKSAEIQDVNVSAVFGFSPLGAEDENLEAKIKEEKEAVNTGFWGFIKTMNKIFQVVTMLARVGQLVVGVIEVFQLGKVAFDAGTIELELVPPPPLDAPGILARASFCMGSDLTAAGIGTTLDWLQIPLQVLTCQKVSYHGSDGTPQTSGLFYVGYITWILNQYNNYATTLESSVLNIGVSEEKDKITIPPATSVYDNIYLSAISVCIPGLVHNAEKYRQIKCRYISCLENEVPAGQATVKACGELQSVLTCKYIWGPLFQLIPFFGIIEAIGKGLQTLLTDPIALVSSGVILGCSISCLNAPKGAPRLELSSACVQAYFLIKMVKLIENVAAGVQDAKAMFGSSGGGYCEQLKDEEELEEEAEEEQT